MKCFLVILIASVGIGCAQSREKENPAEPDKTHAEEGAVVLCRLESITWNPQTQELSWVISIRDLASDKSQPAVQQKYTIHMDAAVMSFEGEDRHFDPDEARRVGKLMDFISTYTVESTLWWSNGQGEQPNGKDGTKPGPKDKGTDKPKPAPPPARVPVGVVRPESPAQTSCCVSAPAQF